MSPETIAKQLRDAASEGKTIAPLRTIIGEGNIDAAYKIQKLNTDFRVANGARIVGKKIGLTSETVQKQVGVDQPDFGILFHDMEVLNGLSISMSELMQPRVESEIAFVLGQDLDQDSLTMVDIIDAIDYCVPAIEIVGSRIEHWDIQITDTIADNASASHFVIGHTPKTLDEIDVVHCTMKLNKNGKLASEGSGAACLGSPLNALLWLAKKMVELELPLEAGELVFSGALGPLVAVEAGDKIQTEISGLGSVSVHFKP